MKQGSFQVRAGKLEKEFARLFQRGVSAGVVPAIMNRRAEVFGKGKDLRQLVSDRLGWVDIASSMKRRLAGIESFGERTIEEGLRHVVLMGMGGSSLCPEVFKFFFKKHTSLKSYDVLDSTAPDAVKAVRRKVDLAHTLFIVASKSGGTVETRSQEAYFIGQLQATDVADFGRNFAAITDKGSALEKFARRYKYQKIFLNPADIGGRYSALSYFGLVPAFFAGVNLRKFIDDAVTMEEILREREDESNPGLVLGALMAAGAKTGIDKLTFAASPRTSALVPWIEQLIAESTGKRGKGILPVEGEPLGAIDRYDKDRMFVSIRMSSEDDPIPKGLRRELGASKVPIVDMTLGSKYELGRQFLLWEAATATAGVFMGINPFDEPNVTESKENTKRILAGYGKLRSVPNKTSEDTWGSLTLIGAEGVTYFNDGERNDLRLLLKRFFAGAKKNGYVALLNYFKADRNSEASLAKIRNLIRNKSKLATTRGYGPRYLHSIGQFYKGGPSTGMFIIFVRDSYGNVPVPGQIFDFGQLIMAQAIGDSQALTKRNLPTLVISIDGSPVDGLEYFAKTLRSALT